MKRTRYSTYPNKDIGAKSGYAFPESSRKKLKKL